MKIHDLGTYDIKDDIVDTNFISFEAQVWDCSSCNSVLLAVYADRLGSSSSDTDYVKCPMCGDKSHRIYSATFPEVKVLVNGEKRCSPESNY
jgi:DNA-directed RNA polymerase subunit RPC12/RpoP